LSWLKPHYLAHHAGLIRPVPLLVNRYVPLAVAVLAPVIVNILVFHALMGFRWPSSWLYCKRDWNNPVKAGRTARSFLFSA
jgi:hypothetical protein